MKHAYLIIAHNKLQNLKALISQIDNVDNDIYLHIDRKWKDFEFDKIKKQLQFSKLTLVKRLNVSWGGTSQLLAEMELFKEAYYSSNKYSYYHLLSGIDLCLKSQTQIHNFFDNCGNKIFLTFCGEDWNSDAIKRIKYYHFENTRNKFISKLEKVNLLVQKIFKIDRLKKCNYKIVGGSNWASLTEEAVKYILDNEEQIHRLFKKGYCVDELYKHTLIFNSYLKEKIYLLKISKENNDFDKDMNKANMRYIDWNRGKPYTFKSEDYDDLINSEYMFARKFDYERDKELIEKILKYTKQ